MIARGTPRPIVNLPSGLGDGDVGGDIPGGVAVKLVIVVKNAVVDFVPVGCVPVSCVPVDSVPLDCTPVDCVPVNCVPVDCVPFDRVPAGADIMLLAVLAGLADVIVVVEIWAASVVDSVEGADMFETKNARLLAGEYPSSHS